MRLAVGVGLFLRVEGFEIAHRRLSRRPFGTVLGPRRLVQTPPLRLAGVRLGDDIPEAKDHVRRQLDVINVIVELAAEVSLPPEPGSDLEVLLDGIGDAPVFLERGIQTYLRTSVECLIHVRSLLVRDEDVSTVVLEALLRPVLMASGRVIFVLASDDRDHQLERALVVLRLEGDSYLRALKSFSQFRHLPGLRPPPDLVAEVSTAVAAIRSRAPKRGESQVLREMAKLISAALTDRFTSDAGGDAMGEALEHAWHMFSGGAHGYVWPDNMPGDFISSFGLVVPVAHVAMDLAVKRTRL